MRNIIKKLSGPYVLGAVFTCVLTLTVVLFTEVQFATGRYDVLQARINLAVTPASAWLALAMSLIRREPTYREFIRNVFVVAVVLTVVLAFVAGASGNPVVETEILGKQVGNAVTGFILVLLSRVTPQADADAKGRG